MERLYKRISRILICVSLIIILFLNFSASYTIAATTKSVKLGNTRVETAINIEQFANENGGLRSAAVLVSYNDNTDGIAATSLGLPIFYNKDNSTTITNNELRKRLKEFSKIYVIGGEKVISETVVKDLKSLKSNMTVERLYGSTRYETSIAIAQEIKDNGNLKGILLVKSSLDSNLTASTIVGIAARKDYAILYNDSSSVNTSVAKFINNTNVPVYAIGDVNTKGIKINERIEGSNIYELNKNLIHYFGSYEKIILVPNTIDIVPAAYLAKVTNASIVLSNSTDIGNYDIKSMQNSTIYPICSETYSKPIINAINTLEKPSGSSNSIPVTSINLNSTNTTIKVNQQIKLTAKVVPTNASNQKITWESSNTSVATVDNTGKITGKKAGTVTITVKSNNGKVATCKVTVSNSISDEAMKFLAGVIYAESGSNEKGQRAVGYVIKNRMEKNITTDKLLQVLTSKNQFSSVKTSKTKAQNTWENKNIMSITYKGKTYYTKKYISSSLSSAKGVMNGTATNPIGNRKYFWEKGYFKKNCTTKMVNRTTVGPNTFFDWK